MPPRAVFLGLDGTPQLTENEQRFVKALFKSLTAVPEADWDKCAQELGLKDSKCAKERWRQISTKRGWTGHVRRATCTTNSACEASATTTAASEDSPAPEETPHSGTQSVAKRPESEQAEAEATKTAVPKGRPSRKVKENNVKKENTSDNETEVEHEMKPPGREDNARGSKFFKRKGTFKKGEPTVTPKIEPKETINEISAIPSASGKRKRGTEREIINLDSDDEDMKASERKRLHRNSDQKSIQRDTEIEGVHHQFERQSPHPIMEHEGVYHDAEGDNQQPDHGAHIPFGHPNHCMSF